MICAHCRRPLKRPAACIGRLCFGPVCARSLGLLAQPSVRHAVCDVSSRVERDDRTKDMFEGVAA
jgi:hypothetical protein